MQGLTVKSISLEGLSRGSFSKNVQADVARLAGLSNEAVVSRQAALVFEKNAADLGRSV